MIDFAFRVTKGSNYKVIEAGNKVIRTNGLIRDLILRFLGYLELCTKKM